jgi:hypothetical protein
VASGQRQSVTDDGEELVVEMKAAGVDQSHDRGRGEHLRHAGQIES